MSHLIPTPVSKQIKVNWAHHRGQRRLQSNFDELCQIGHARLLGHLNFLIDVFRLAVNSRIPFEQEAALEHQEFGLNPSAFEHLIDDLADKGFSVRDDILTTDILDPLYGFMSANGPERFEDAGIGRGAGHQIAKAIRGDKIHWLDLEQPYAAPYLRFMSELRLKINRALFMGLFDYEAHLARYPAGQVYRKHVDAFVGRSNRVLTTVAYLNKHWSASAGGQLRVYSPNDAEQVFQTVEPHYGRLVCFLSTDFSHEVLPAKLERWSIAGWFRVNTNLGDTIDPPAGTLLPGDRLP
ncbi:MAG: 2OG-Fe(II) oxygenase [Gammaproteobacteria bacterium]|nr:2OG-Fe(II) oxygenase [Gammaproteobacteria bacterium]